MKLHVAAVGLIALSGGLVSSRPQEAAAVEPVAVEPAAVEPVAVEPVADAAPVEVAADADATTITEEELQKEEELEDYYDYTWKEQLMAPVRNVGQMLSGGVKGAAESINTGLSAANEWWDGGSGDADYEPYENEYDQVNNWWDAMEQEQYEYEEKEEKPKPVEGAEVDETDMDDYDAYESIWDEIKYPKPEDSKVEAKQIHKPSETRVVLKRMKNRNQQPYGVDDYFDFVVIAMCVVLLFIMMLAGVSRYNNQRYLKKAYGRGSEKSPLLRA